jgi:hypothetical protein
VPAGSFVLSARNVALSPLVLGLVDCATFHQSWAPRDFPFVELNEEALKDFETLWLEDHPGQTL